MWWPGSTPSGTGNRSSRRSGFGDSEGNGASTRELRAPVDFDSEPSQVPSEQPQGGTVSSPLRNRASDDVGKVRQVANASKLPEHVYGGTVQRFHRQLEPFTTGPTRKLPCFREIEKESREPLIHVPLRESAVGRVRATRRSDT